MNGVFKDGKREICGNKEGMMICRKRKKEKTLKEYLKMGRIFFKKSLVSYQWNSNILKLILAPGVLDTFTLSLALNFEIFCLCMYL